MSHSSLHSFSLLNITYIFLMPIIRNFKSMKWRQLSTYKILIFCCDCTLSFRFQTHQHYIWYIAKTIFVFLWYPSYHEKNPIYDNCKHHESLLLLFLLLQPACQPEFAGSWSSSKKNIRRLVRFHHLQFVRISLRPANYHYLPLLEVSLTLLSCMVF